MLYAAIFRQFKSLHQLYILWKYIALNCFFFLVPWRCNPEMLKQFLYIKYLAWICNSLCRSLSNATICRCITYSKYLLHDKSIQLRECSPKLQLTAFYDTNLISLFILPGYNSYYLGNMNNGSGYNLFFFLFDNINSVHWRVWNFTMHVKYLYLHGLTKLLFFVGKKWYLYSYERIVRDSSGNYCNYQISEEN